MKNSCSQSVIGIFVSFLFFFLFFREEGKQREGEWGRQQAEWVSSAGY